LHVDSLIHARWIIPVEPDNQVMEHYALAIHQGLVSAVLPSEQAKVQITADETITLSDHALIPGFINAHTHTPMSLFRGLADDLPLMDWLTEHIWPAEQRWVHEDFVADGSRLAMAEMIRSGTTCFNDMYFFPDVTGQVAMDAGMRAVIGMILIDFPSSWADNADDYLTRAVEVHDQFKACPLVHPVFAPHAPYSVSDEPLSRVRTLANELDLPIHMHVHETSDEIEQSMKQYQMRPLSRLQQLGLLTPDLLAVHMTQLKSDEIRLFAESGAHVVHCPESNLKLASGFCPVDELLSAGINLALGTDGAASNNDLDMLSEMRTAALLAKGVSGDASALPAFQALKMATLNGANALGLGAVTGSLLPGKSADITAIDLNQVETQPVYDPVSQIVYAAGREQVTDVWVAGKRLLKSGELTTLNQEQILAQTKYWRDQIID
jgi:5-methylthioadenosine/S-adenosylhomocysteine deaminase